jgi:uncharacterized protein YbaR (Trm112 family)
VIIFGWGKQTRKDHGPTMHLVCPNCHNEAWWHLYTIRNWFTLLLVRAVPYDTQYLLLCPVCSRGLRLNSDRFRQARSLSQATRAHYKDRTMSAQEYADLVNQAQVLPPAGGRK